MDIYGQMKSLRVLVTRPGSESEKDMISISEDYKIITRSPRTRSMIPGLYLDT